MPWLACRGSEPVRRCSIASALSDRVPKRLVLQRLLECPGCIKGHKRNPANLAAPCMGPRSPNFASRVLRSLYAGSRIRDTRTVPGCAIRLGVSVCPPYVVAARRPARPPSGIWPPAAKYAFGALEDDRDGLIEAHASLVPEAIDATGSEERHRVYKMTGLKALLGADGALGLSGDTIDFPRNGISSP